MQGSQVWQFSIVLSLAVLVTPGPHYDNRTRTNETAILLSRPCTLMEFVHTAQCFQTQFRLLCKGGITGEWIKGFQHMCVNISNSTGPLQHQHRTTAASVQDHCSISTGPLQHQHRTTAASAQDHCSISTGPLQHQHRTTAALAQDHCSISTGPLQHQHRTTAALAQDHCSISTGPLQHQHRSTAASAQDHCSISTGPLQH
ncbi:unnamed protein product [Plutella xylostella]|uniref:(diamondback moth) hypothetical protein n=1 Tax=Plutella xylostella TaxID=51655 RepID=A0A8S4DNM5_PLUXY|nr:unnamed protein product [Plutella xylostella]